MWWGGGGRGVWRAQLVNFVVHCNGDEAFVIYFRKFCSGLGAGTASLAAQSTLGHKVRIASACSGGYWQLFGGGGSYWRLFRRLIGGHQAAIRTLLGTCSAWCLADWTRRLSSQPLRSVDKTPHRGHPIGNQAASRQHRCTCV